MSSQPVTSQPQVIFVPHTHWDREWYEPFQVFRLRLVAVLDDVIERAEADPDFRFTIDGQMAAVEDYLEVRPENRKRIAALVDRGQLAVGPWHILLDEFLCSGETIVRNLEMGTRGAAALGGAMQVGYLPDMFGHCVQMPQILARAGIEHACLWRGVVGWMESHAFRWSAPDGSTVRVEYLWDGYGNGLDLFAFPERLREAVAAYREDTRSRYGTDPVLAMLGSDHSSPRPDLMPLVRSAGLSLATLDEYVARYRPDDPDIPHIGGELRSHARGNILPGVLSIRVGLKQAMATAERMLGVAEAIAAQWSDSSFAQYRDIAWRKVIECTAHDSVTGCGVDETAEQVESRLAEATHMGRAIRDTVVNELAREVPSDHYLVVNPSPWPRTMVCEFDVPGDGQWLMAEEKIDADDLDLLLRRIHGRELFGQQIERYSVEPGQVVFEVAEVPSTPSFDKAALRADLERAAAETPGMWTVRTLAQERATRLATIDVPASGHVAVDPMAEAGTIDHPVTVDEDGRVLDNGLVRVEVDEQDGTLTVRGADGTVLRGVGRLVDGGDRGDSYNYGPPAADVVVDSPDSVRSEAVEVDPVRAIVRIVREYEWPVSLSDDPDTRSAQTVRVPVTTDVTLHAGEPFVRLTVSFVNQAADHRLRLHVPLPGQVEHSHAEGQFGVTTRELIAEGGWGEYPLPTYPASSFVAAHRSTVLLDHVTEYEVTGEGTELALTLLRAVGWMSVNVHPLRDEPAGSQIAVPGAQYIGREVTARLAIVPSSWRDVDASRLAAQFRNGPLIARGRAQPGVASLEPVEGIGVAGARLDVPSIRQHADGVEVRLVGMSRKPTEAVITGPFDRAVRTDLLGRELDELAVERQDDHPGPSGRLVVALGPWEIATVVLRSA
jgi:mannosylglycerate hydrolase